MRVLIVAPSNAGLASTVEIDSIAPAHDTDIVSDNVTQVRLMQRVARQKYDIVHFLTHGSAAGVQLSDGIMAPEDIARLAKHTRARLIFLNACSSTRPGQYLVDVGIPAVIAHNRDVPDNEAIQVAAYFYNELATNGGDMKSAYGVASPHDGTLSWLSNGNYRDPLLQEIISLRESGNRREERQIALYRGVKWLCGGLVFNALLTAGLWAFQVLH